jgi:hypothetical protein
MGCFMKPHIVREPIIGAILMKNVSFVLRDGHRF